MFEKLLDEFMPAEELREYLKKESISDFNMADIIFYSLMPVEKKRDALFELEQMDLSKERQILREYWIKYRLSIEEALKLKELKGAIFIVYERSIYGDNVDSDEWLQGIFSSYAAAESFVKEDTEKKKNEEDQMSWYEINLWIKGDNDSYVDTCTYYYIDGELIYTEFDLSNDFHENCTDGELRIPVSYKPGDILIADRYPFGHKEKFVMLEIGDNHDCCCLQALCKKVGGIWDVGAVKHGMIGSIGYPKMSVFYTAKRYEPNLSNPEDVILAKVSELIDGDENRGTVIWDKVYSANSDEEIMTILESVDFSTQANKIGNQ